MAGQLVEGEFAIANALPTLLSTEGLLFAALALAANLVAPSGNRLRRLPVKPVVLGTMAVSALVAVAAGAFAAWLEIFSANSPQSISHWIICISILIAIVSMPILAVMLCLGLREMD